MFPRILSLLALVTLCLPVPAAARPIAPSIFCQVYPTSPSCTGRLAACSTCHTSTWPARWNDYGLEIQTSLIGNLEDDLANTLVAIEGLDTDGDGVPNLDEIEMGTGPGDPDEVWPWCLSAPPRDGVMAAGYDFQRALRRVSILYCGRSPTFEELAALDTVAANESALHAAVHETLDRCLSGAYWRDEGLARLADRRIRPIGAVGADTPVGIIIADYEWDYRLFAYVMTENRDVRDLLLAGYHVVARPDGRLEVVQGTIPPAVRGRAGGQPLVPERRAGMITTQWFFAINTMFSPMPRTTAAQAYRAYLGQDIAQLEGIYPIAAEPLDVDRKGVAEQQCASCHSTLDPLSYAFASYEGIVGERTGAYDASRPSRLMSDWVNPQSYLLGTPVDDVRAWAEHAVTTDAFKRNLGMMFFRHALNRDPAPDESTEVEACWRALPEDGWSANRLIHRLVDTAAFGVE